MLSPLVLAALVTLIKVVFEVYLPQFPITPELINSILVVLLGWFGLEGVKAGVAKYRPQLSRHFR